MTATGMADMTFMTWTYFLQLWCWKTHQQCSHWEYCAKISVAHYEWKSGELPSLTQDGRVIWCQTDNHLLVVLVTEEGIIPGAVAWERLLARKFLDLRVRKDYLETLPSLKMLM